MDLIKVVMVGNMAVGKSALMRAYIDGVQAEGAPRLDQSTMGVDFKDKIVERGGRRLRLQIWDTAGQERYRTITRAYYRGATVIVMVYDVTARQSFTDLMEWRCEIVKHSRCRKMFLIGNKFDMATPSSRQVLPEEARRFAAEYDLGFFETSAWTGHNVELAFEAMCDAVTQGVPQAGAEAKAGSPRQRVDRVDSQGRPVTLGLRGDEPMGSRRCSC